LWHSYHCIKCLGHVNGSGPLFYLHRLLDRREVGWCRFRIRINH
jgi:hypothetical protein